MPTREEFQGQYSRLADGEILELIASVPSSFVPEAWSALLEEAQRRRLRLAEVPGLDRDSRNPPQTIQQSTLRQLVSTGTAKAVSLFVGLIGIAVVSLVLNVVFVGVQKLWHHVNQVKFERLRGELQSDRRRIDGMESQLRAMVDELDQSESELKDLRGEIDKVEQRHPAGVPSKLYEGYSRMVERHNDLVNAHSALLDRQRVLYQDYLSEIERYNSLAGEANSLARKANTTWYLIPIPRVGMSGTSGIRR